MRLSLVQIVLVTAAVAALAASAVVYRVTGEQIDRHVESTLLARAEVYANVAVAIANHAPDERELHRSVHALGVHREVLDVLVFGKKDLEVLGATRHQSLGAEASRIELVRIGTCPPTLAGGAEHQLDLVAREFQYLLPFSFSNLNQPDLRSLPDSEVPGLVCVRIDASEVLHRAAVQKNTLLFVVLGTVGFVLVLGLGMMVHQLLLPLRRIETSMEQRRARAGAATPPSMPNRDLHRLAESVWANFAALEKSNDHIRAIVDCATDSIITIDRKGIIVQFNPGAERMFGVTAGEAIGREMSFLIPPELRRFHEEALSAVVEGRKPQILGFSREVEALRADGSRFPCSLAVNAMPWRGETHYVGILCDRTKEVEAAAALALAREEAQAGERTKASFLANVSHEIRTPLTAILGYAEELEHATLTPEQRAEAIRVVQRNGEHLTRIVDDILDLSKLERGSMQIQRRACCPEEILDDVKCVVLSRCRQKGIDFSIRRFDPLPSSIDTDPVRLRQILLNLVGNAIKYTDEGSVAIEVSADYAAHSMTFAVIDTGIGIADDQRHLLFQSFSQADNSITRKHGGTGLGLHISRRIAHLLGGDITVESAPGRGSRFAVTVATGPMAGHVPSVVQPKANTSVPVLRGRVLVADDGPDNRKLIERIVKTTGLEVEVVENGALAVDRVLNAPPSQAFDLVLMDMQMPVMDGLAATRALRDAGYTRPIVALTANVLPEDRQRCADAGCSHFAGKPVDRKALYALLTEMFAAKDVSPARVS